jgi:Flavodoxin domain
MADSEVTMNSPECCEDPRSTRALVVYESMFGNTAAIAQAIARGLTTAMETTVIDVASATSELNEFDLLVVGAPTHAFGLSRRQTREDAGRRGAPADAARSHGVREWISTIDRQSICRTAVATFDTRVRRPRLPGSAGRAARRRLRRLGVSVEAPVSFWVTGTPGPLVDGELDRARRWGEELVAVHAAPKR